MKGDPAPEIAPQSVASGQQECICQVAILAYASWTFLWNVWNNYVRRVGASTQRACLRSSAHELREEVRTLRAWADHESTKTPHRKSLETSRT